MKGHGRLLCLATLLMICGGSVFAAPAQGPPGRCDAKRDSAPCIDKIDPPSWWAGLPDPMLLVHGEGLNHARFALSGTGVTLNRTQASENGHWAFLWLETRSAAPQTVWITASNDQGQSRSSYVLAERSHQADGHSGFSSADVLYLIMTDRFAEGNAAGDPPGDDRAAARGWHGGDLSGIENHLD